MNSKIFMASPHMSDEGYEKEFVKEAFDTNWIAPLGNNVNEFEKEIASFVGVKASTALSAGTAALHMAMKAVGIKRGDIVFCSDFTFSATVNPILYEGGIPVFIDSEMSTWNMSPDALEKAFQKYSPKAVVVAHLYGLSADMDRIMQICNKYNVPIVEDAAEALGTKYKGKCCGTFGDYGAYSFNGNKIITTSGGGMLVSDNEEMVKKVRFWATQSREPERHYEHKEVGYNYRMSNVCAGIGRGQMKVISDRIAKKNYIYNYYLKAFADIADIQMMPMSDFVESNCWLSAMVLKSSCKVKALDVILALENDNIESRPLWKPMHMQPLFKDNDFVTQIENDVSVGEDLFGRGLCLPSDTKMTDEDLARVVGVIRNMF